MRARLLVFGYPLAEVVAVYLVHFAIGWGWTFLLLLLGIPVGISLMRHARTPAGLLAGLLVAIPGFCTDIAGLILLLPPVQRHLSRRAQVWVEAQRFPGMVRPVGPMGGYHGGDVIPGVVVDPGDELQR